MDKINSSMVAIREFLATKNPLFFLVLFADTEVEVDGDLHVTQFNTRLVSKSKMEEYQKLIAKGTNVLMNTTPKD